MRKNNNPTIISSAYELFKSFCDEKGDILIDENCNPDLIQDLNKLNAMMEINLELSLIANISYQKHIRDY